MCEDGIFAGIIDKSIKKDKNRNWWHVHFLWYHKNWWSKGMFTNVWSVIILLSSCCTGPHKKRDEKAKRPTFRRVPMILLIQFHHKSQLKCVLYCVVYIRHQPRAKAYDPVKIKICYIYINNTYRLPLHVAELGKNLSPSKRRMFGDSNRFNFGSPNTTDGRLWAC
jgi:hypothetical protein